MDEIVRAVTTDGFVKISAVTARGAVERAREIHSLSPTASAALGRTLCGASMLGELMKEDDASLTIRVNGGGPAAVMEAAKAAGARGGTVLHGRRMGEADEKSGESGVWPEKDIVTILVPRELRQPIMEAVNHAAGAATESRGVLFSLPVEHAMGLSWRES